MWGALGALAQAGLQFGSNAGSAMLNAKITRDLRRTAYQDQMHSMRAAGLNPILAAGAQPGYSNTGTMDPGNISNAVDSSFRASKNKEEQALLRAQETTAIANAREAQAKADTAEALRDAQVRGAGAQADLTGARAAIEGSRADWRDTLASTEAYGAVNRLEQSRQRTAANLPAMVRARGYAEAGLTSAREVGTRAQNVGREMEARWIRDYESMIRAGKTADEILDRLGPIADLALRRGNLNLGDRRNRDSNARDAQRQEREHRDTVTREREQDRRDRAEERRRDNGSRF